MLLSLVVPCYNEDTARLPLMTEAVCEPATLTSVQIEIIFIYDGSTEDILQITQHLAVRHAWVQWYLFSCNFGKGRAISRIMQGYDPRLFRVTPTRRTIAPQGLGGEGGEGKTNEG